MKKLASSLLVCSLLVSGYQASANTEHEFDDLTDWISLSEKDSSTANITLSTDDFKGLIEKSVEKAALKVARDKRSVRNIVNESKKTRKSSTLWEIVKFPFSATWNILKSVVVLALALALPLGGTYAFASSSREAIKTDLNNIIKALKESNSANKVSELTKSAYAKTSEVFNSIVEKVKAWF